MRTSFTHGPKLPVVGGTESGRRPRALVTGASSGIGWACAEMLRDCGFEVIGTSRKGAAAPHPAGVEMVALDMSDPVLPGDFDVLILNAGESQSGPLEELPREALERLFQVNVIGQVQLMQQALPYMRAQGRGRIVVIGSMLGGLPLPFRSSYVASKAAVRGVAMALRGEVAKYGVGVTVVEPGSINTGISQRRTKYIAGDSPYQADFTTMLTNLDANEATGISAEQIAGVVKREIESDRPVALTAEGSKAQLVGPLTRLIPTQATLRLMCRVHGLRA